MDHTISVRVDENDTTITIIECSICGEVLRGHIDVSNFYGKTA